MELPRALAAMTGLVFASVTFGSPPAMAAQAPAPTPVDAKFRARDTNRDGFITKGEMKRYRDYDRAFDHADLNRDGKLSTGEFAKAEAIYLRLQDADYVDDSFITAKVKAALLKELKLPDVGVETRRGRVLLTGIVDGKAQRIKAIQIAASVDGVVEVENGLGLK